MSVGKGSYDFGQKNNWRRMQWNSIRDWLRGRKIRPRDAQGIFLPGPQCLDVAVAKAKGFDPLNLVAVDESGEVAATVRSMRSCPIINAPLGDVVLSWCPDQRLDFIVADLCTNLSQSALGLAAALPVLMETRTEPVAVVVNLLRGRERGTYFDIACGPESVRRVKEITALGHTVSPKSRALAWLDILAQFTMAYAAEWWGRDAERVHHYKRFSQYKSGAQVMDSVFLELWPTERRIGRRAADLFVPRLRIGKDVHTAIGPSKRRALRRRIGAALAVRTMRREGTLPVGRTT
jgi:hypothetical protein